MIPLLLVLALPSAAATVVTTGLVVNGEGTVGHGEILPAPAPFDAANTSVQLGSHPQDDVLPSIYTLLASRDVFNTTDGSEAALAAHAPPFAGHGTAGVDLNAFGVSGTVYYSLRGFELDYLTGSDYYYNLGTDVETRLYRGGEIEFYHDAGGGPVAFARSSDVVLDVKIDWNTFVITQTMLSSTPDLGPGMLASMNSSVSVSNDPAQTVDSTTEGAPYAGGYGIFNDVSTTWGFDQVVSVPVLNGLTLGALSLVLLGVGQRILSRGSRD